MQKSNLIKRLYRITKDHDKLVKKNKKKFTVDIKNMGVNIDKNEYYEIKDPQELADWLENNANEDVLEQRGFRGNYLELARADLASRN